VTFAVMAILMLLGLKVIPAAIITFLTVVSIYIIIAVTSNKRRLSLLDEKCDPEEFLAATEKQKQVMKKEDPKIEAYLDINRAVAFISMGRFDEAKKILLLIDKEALSHKNGSLFAYTVNLIVCYYELGEIDSAEELFETQMPVLPPVNKRMELFAKILVAERLFFLKRYGESREHFERLLNEKKLSKRSRLEILYRLAQMDELDGNAEAAFKKYKKIADYGNKLWIAEKAREKCGNMPVNQVY